MNDITVIIPTSPIPSHPSTEVIERAIDSIRLHLPDSRILILADGIRQEMQHRKDQYLEYIRRLYALAREKYSHIDVVPFPLHRQQAGMLKWVMDDIHTPLLMFFEHDATLDDKPIEWDAIKALLFSSEANTVRFYWHQELHPEHSHLMLDRFGPFVKTVQWSSWPHVSRTSFYQRILAQHFADDDKKMTETVLYSPVLESPWEEYKTVIYAPEPDAIRFHHWDARRDPKTGEKDPGDW